MKSSVEKLSDTRVKLTVEVPFDELGKEFDAAYKTIAQQVNIPGFRKGKAPRQLIDARFGRGVVMEQVINDMLPSRYGAAVEENELPVMGQPDIDVTKLEDGELVEFTAEVDVRPEITLPKFDDFAVEVEALKADDEAVEAELESLRRRFATRVVVDRAAAEGDIVTLSLSAEVDGKIVEEVAAEDVTHVVGKDEMIDGIDEAVTGLSADETATFTTTLAADEYKDKEAVVTVTVTKVQADELPALDDDFAEMASEFDSLEELREDTVKTVTERAKAGQAGQIRDAVLAKALESCEFELPAGVVEQQIQGQTQQLLSQIGGDEKLLDSILAGQDMTRADFEARTREEAEDAVRTQLFLDCLADDVSPEVSQQELSEHIMFTAQAYGMDPNQFLSQLQSSGQIGNLFADVRRGKALAAAICRVTVTDSEGNSVDPSDYFGEEEESAEAEEN